MNRNDTDLNIEHGNERVENDKNKISSPQFSTFKSDDDYVVFIPDEDYYSLMRSLDKMEQAQKEFHKIRDSLNNGRVER